MKMTATQDKAGVITITVEPTKNPQPSASGKSLTLFTTGGLDRRTDLPDGFYVNLTIGKALAL